MTLRKRTCAAVLVAALCAGVPALGAQNPAMLLTPEERDSALANYNQTFPIWGRKAVERGIDLPAPFGINLGIFGMAQDVNISDLGLGFNAPPQPVSFITFEGARARLGNYQLRADLWLFPFLNVYVMGGLGNGQTTVRIATPVQFESVADFIGGNIGLGSTVTFPLKTFFGVVDYNHQWGFSDLLDAPVPANILGIRLGRAFRIGPRANRTRATFWAGTMFQSLEANTNGSIKLSEVVPPGLDSAFSNYQNEPWYQALPPGQQALVDNFVQRLSGSLDTTIVNYQLQKKVADPWNMVVGGTVDRGRHWGLRWEVGFIGRVSGMLMVNYRMKI